MYMYIYIYIYLSLSYIYIYIYIVNQLGDFNGARVVGVNFIKGAQLCLI
jgi:hypothetical protein